MGASGSCDMSVRAYLIDRTASHPTRFISSSTVSNLTFLFHSCPMPDVWILIWRYHIRRDKQWAENERPSEKCSLTPVRLSEDRIRGNTQRRTSFWVEKRSTTFDKAIASSRSKHEAGTQSSSAKLNGFLSLSRSRSKPEFAEKEINLRKCN
jgi:hypothetical protein